MVYGTPTNPECRTSGITILQAVHLTPFTTAALPRLNNIKTIFASNWYVDNILHYSLADASVAFLQRKLGLFNYLPLSVNLHKGIYLNGFVALIVLTSLIACKGTFDDCTSGVAVCYPVFTQPRELPVSMWLAFTTS